MRTCYHSVRTCTFLLSLAADCNLGILTLSTPFLNAAAMRSPAASGGRRKERWKAPYSRSEKKYGPTHLFVRGSTRRAKAPDAFSRLAGTPYANYARVTTTGGAGRSVADVHNLVTLSRFPIRTFREVRDDFVSPPSYRSKTAIRLRSGTIATMRASFLGR
jgi:hypothetical protein